MSILQTDKFIIFHYRPGDGGKFLTNCLGLSSQFVLQDQNLAQKQLDNQLDSAQKFNLIMDRLNRASANWNDLGLGDWYFGTIITKDFDESQLHPVCGKIHAQNLFFTACCHTTDEIHSTLKNWPNAKIISFINNKNFLSTYRPSSLDGHIMRWKEYWNNIRGANWPVTPPSTLDEIRSLPRVIQDELETTFSNVIYQHINCTIDTLPFILGPTLHPIFIWDCDWYLDAEATVNSVECLYNLLGLTDFNPEWVKAYWSKWVEKLTVS